MNGNNAKVLLLSNAVNNRYTVGGLGEREWFTIPAIFSSSITWPLDKAGDGPHNYLQLSSLPAHQLHPLLIPDPQAVNLIYTQP